MGVPLSQMWTVASYVLKQKFSGHPSWQRIGRDEPSKTTALSQTISSSVPERKDSTRVPGQKSNQRKGRKRYPLVLMLEPLFRCNLACAGCGKIQYPAHVLKQQLTPEECFRAVEECGAPMVSIPGGEPLMHSEIEKIVEGLVARKKYIYLCTNALLLKEKLHLFKPSKYLTFS